ncbi:MAG: IS21-like element helper ATPase IstB [Gammaproteobacteria bacterium]
MSAAVDRAAVQAHCRSLRLPAVAAHCERLAEEALRSHCSPLNYLEALLAAEVDERERHTIQRRLKDARLPRLKTLEEFDFSAAPQLPAPRIRALAEGQYLAHAEPVILIGDAGTGKTHLATGLCVAACRQKKRVRFTTAAGLVNDLVEAQQHNLLGRALGRWSRYDLIALDEVGYVPLAQLGAELLFQVISEQAERTTFIVTTNLPFSEWTQVFPNARLCKALLDRLTDRAHIIETGTESYRFKRTVAGRKGVKG